MDAHDDKPGESGATVKKESEQRFVSRKQTYVTVCSAAFPFTNMCKCLEIWVFTRHFFFLFVGLVTGGNPKMERS